MDVQGSVIAFITIAITLSLAVVILGSTAADCTTQSGYDGPTNSTGWAALCLDNEIGTQNAFSLMPVVLIVLVAVIILAILGMLRSNNG